MFVDFHTHSTNSDGTKSVSEIFELAKLKQLKVLSVTDHDNIDGQTDALKKSIGYGINYITGVEISCNHENTLHMLGFNINTENNEIVSFLNRMLEHRNKRNKEIVSRLRKIGFEVTLEEIEDEANGKSIGRPHIARVLMGKGYVDSLEEAFEKYIGDKGKAYVERFRFSTDESIAMIKESGGLAILAHPLSLKLSPDELSIKVDELVLQGLDGMEVFYKDYTEAEVEILLGIAKKFHLLCTGGSDFHGENKPAIEMGVEIPRLFVEEFMKSINHRI